MTQWSRVVYSFVASVVAVGLGTIVEMMLSASSSAVRIGDFIFSPFFVVPVFVIAYLLAPRLARRLRFE
jgi:hypothetical protein